MADAGFAFLHSAYEPLEFWLSWTVMTLPLRLYIVLILLGLASCEAPEESVGPQHQDLRVRYSLTPLPEKPEYPVDNQRNKDRISLGWRLFYDPILSVTQDVACGTCHHAQFGMSDGRALSLGVGARGLGPGRSSTGGAVNVVERHSLSIINAAFIKDSRGHSPLFWDGRARSLEEQSLLPIQNAIEMAGPGISPETALDTIIMRLRRLKLYQAFFNQAFPEQADSVAHGLISSTINVTTLSKALAAYQREIISANSAYDRFARGTDTALNELEKLGLDIFYGKAGCGSCHSGPMLSDFRMYGQGVGSISDHGAGNYAFRTPSLRNLEHTAPYMHDGSMKTLDEVIDYYNKGIAANAELPKASIDARFKPLGLTPYEKSALRAFLLALRDDSWEKVGVPPSIVPSNLPVPR
jgi:cytochrome c peroxidase